MFGQENKSYGNNDTLWEESSVNLVYNTSKTILNQLEFLLETNGTEGQASYDAVFHLYLYQVAAPALFVIITLIGIIGNSLVIFVIVSKRKMRSSMNMLLLNLAFSDITFLTFCVPFMAYHYAAESWIMGDVMCKLTQFLLYVTVFVTVYTLILISALRFLIIVHASESARIRTKRNILLMIALIWGMVLLLNVPILLFYRVKMFPLNVEKPYYYCGMENIQTGQKVFIVFFLFAYLLPLSVIFTLYMLMLRYLRKKQSDRRKCETPGSMHSVKERTSHATKIVFTVVFVFGLSWLPLHIHLLIAYFGKQPESYLYQVFRLLCHCLAYGNPSMNPIIYNYVSRDFRKSFREIFRPCCCQQCQEEQNTTEHENIALNTNGVVIGSSTACM